MKISTLSFTEKEQQLFTAINLLFNIAKKRPIEELHAIMNGELRELQPALPDTLKHLYRTQKYTKQFEDLMRIMLLIWLYYQPEPPASFDKIDEPLYKQMVDRHAVWNNSFKGQSRDVSMQKWIQCIEEHPSGCLLWKLYGICVAEPYNSIKKLPVQDRVLLLDNFKIILDCFDHLAAGQ